MKSAPGYTLLLTSCVHVTAAGKGKVPPSVWKTGSWNHPPVWNKNWAHYNLLEHKMSNCQTVEPVHSLESQEDRKFTA